LSDKLEFAAKEKLEIVIGAAEPRSGGGFPFRRLYFI